MTAQCNHGILHSPPPLGVGASGPDPPEYPGHILAPAPADLPPGKPPNPAPGPSPEHLPAGTRACLLILAAFRHCSPATHHPYRLPPAPPERPRAAHLLAPTRPSVAGPLPAPGPCSLGRSRSPRPPPLRSPKPSAPPFTPGVNHQPRVASPPFPATHPPATGSGGGNTHLHPCLPAHS